MNLYKASKKYIHFFCKLPIGGRFVLLDFLFTWYLFLSTKNKKNEFISIQFCSVYCGCNYLDIDTMCKKNINLFLKTNIICIFVQFVHMIKRILWFCSLNFLISFNTLWCSKYSVFCFITPIDIQKRIHFDTKCHGLHSQPASVLFVDRKGKQSISAA